MADSHHLERFVRAQNPVYTKVRAELQIFGSPDDLKFHSSVTLFTQVAPDEPSFQRALDRYFDGEFDARTLELL